MSIRAIDPTGRCFIFVQWAERDTANEWAARWDPDDGSNTFGGVRLSDDGGVTVTHTGCSTVVDDIMLNGTNGILTAMQNVPFVAVYRASDGWTWETALADAGLTPITQDA